MQYCFLNAVFTDSERKVYETVTWSEEEPLKNKVEYVDENGLRSVLSRSGTTFDFGLRDGFVIWGNEGPTLNEKTDVLKQYLSQGIVTYENGISTLYDLLSTLIKINAVYLDYSTSPEKPAENLGQLAPLGYGISKFKDLHVSKSTMNVYFSVMTEDGFRTRSLVKMEEGMLQFDGFTFAVSADVENLSQLEDKFSLEFLGYGYKDDAKQAVYRVSDILPIYPNISPTFKLFDPVINYKVFTSERAKIAIDFLKYFVTNMIAAEFPEDDEDKKEKEEQAVPPIVGEKYGVKMTLKYKNLSAQDRKNLLELVGNLVQKSVEEKLTLLETVSYLKKYKLDGISEYACVALLQALSTTSVSFLDRIDAVRGMIDILKVYKLEIDLELFSLRSYIYFSDYRFPFGADLLEITGGNVPYITKLQKKTRG